MDPDHLRRFLTLAAIAFDLPLPDPDSVLPATPMRRGAFRTAPRPGMADAGRRSVRPAASVATRQIKSRFESVL